MDNIVAPGTTTLVYGFETQLITICCLLVSGSRLETELRPCMG